MRRTTRDRYAPTTPTPEERAAYMARKPGARGPAVAFGTCRTCGARLWLSGLGIGSHERSARHNAASRS